jgi:hypothetical protein
MIRDILPHLAQNSLEFSILLLGNEFPMFLSIRSAKVSQYESHRKTTLGCL